MSVTTGMSLLQTLPDHLCALAALNNVVHGPAVAVSHGYWLELQNLRHHHKYTELESAF